MEMWTFTVYIKLLFSFGEEQLFFNTGTLHQIINLVYAVIIIILDEWTSNPWRTACGEAEPEWLQ